ncbi:hypothetical protein PR202_ga23927 [Eleusine coracana subsp. coracana]|uniref:Uncharacterized protein n=1 Tax=Eleusine coracana subsp. coracana TaxID=191504 RepID=A0AAV5D7V7_ELECO|nr:hypothetical protein PR202_ga23927 [Eleusine coracana subsp. coracana]
MNPTIVLPTSCASRVLKPHVHALSNLDLVLQPILIADVKTVVLALGSAVAAFLVEPLLSAHRPHRYHRTRSGLPTVHYSSNQGAKLMVQHVDDVALASLDYSSLASLQRVQLSGAFQPRALVDGSVVGSLVRAWFVQWLYHFDASDIARLREAARAGMVASAPHACKRFQPTYGRPWPLAGIVAGTSRDAPAWDGG